MNNIIYGQTRKQIYYQVSDSTKYRIRNRVDNGIIGQIYAQIINGVADKIRFHLTELKF